MLKLNYEITRKNARELLAQKSGSYLIQWQLALKVFARVQRYGYDGGIK